MGVAHLGGAIGIVSVVQDLRVEVGKGGIVTDCVLNSPVQGHSDICHLLQGMVGRN